LEDFSQSVFTKIILDKSGQHAEQQDKDRVRDAWLNDQGFKVLRFWNNDVMHNLEGVLLTIERACYEPKTK